MVENNALNAPTVMSIAPKSPLFPLLDKKLSLNDEHISSFDSFNTNEQAEGSNYTKCNTAVVRI